MRCAGHPGARTFSQLHTARSLQKDYATAELLRLHAVRGTARIVSATLNEKHVNMQSFGFIIPRAGVLEFEFVQGSLVRRSGSSEVHFRMDLQHQQERELATVFLMRALTDPSEHALNVCVGGAPAAVDDMAANVREWVEGYAGTRPRRRLSAAGARC